MRPREVVEILRRGELPSTEMACLLSRFPAIDEARREISESDMDMLIALTCNADTSISCLAIDLLHPLVRLSPVKNYINMLWRADLSIIERYHLLFRVLEVEDQEDGFHKGCWEWVNQNLDWFLDRRREWYGGKARVIEGVRSRLSDPSFPIRKKWIYLVSLLAADDLNQSRALASTYTTSADPVSCRNRR
jgi:hypothetical protein